MLNASKLADLEQISKLRWVLEHRNIISIDFMAYSITLCDANHIISGKKIENDFINCKLNGEIALDNLVSKFIYSKPSGSIEKLRKELNLKKIVPVLSKKKYTAKPKLPLSKTEKQNLLANNSIDDIPKTSLAMLSPSKLFLHLIFVAKSLNQESLFLTSMLWKLLWIAWKLI